MDPIVSVITKKDRVGFNDRVTFLKGCVFCFVCA